MAGKYEAACFEIESPLVLLNGTYASPSSIATELSVSAEETH